MDIIEQTERAIEEVEGINKKLGCFITVSKDQARTQARELAGSKTKGALFGKIISVKDAICTKGIRTTAGSAMLADYVPPYDAHVIERIKAEGGIIIGKTAMDAFGFGTFCTNVGAGLPVPKNPHDVARATGGSSGGAGAATYALSKNHLGIAESTGGSITAPAAFCGVVGLTPTYGRVSRYGLIDYANSLDKIGTMGKTVTEAETLYRVIAGIDAGDETSTVQIDKKARNVRKIAVVREMLEGVENAILKRFWEAIESMEVPYEEISLPTLEYAVATYYIIASAEASSNLSRYQGMRYGAQEEITGTFSEHFAKIRSKYFSPEEKRRAVLGTFVRTAGYKEKYYFKALAIREKIKEEFERAFKKYDFLITPSMPIIAPRFDEIEKLSPIENYALDSCTIPPNLTGLPHLSLPIGKVRDMPVGLQAIAEKWGENTLFEFGARIEGSL